MDTHQSIIGMILSGGIVVQSVLLLLLVLSVWSWAVVLSKYLWLKKSLKDTHGFRHVFDESRDLPKIDDASQKYAASPLVKLFGSGYKEVIRLLHDFRASAQNTQNTSQKLDENEVRKFIRNALKRAELHQVIFLERGTVFLATTASAAPFIGLFGTVWGIMNAFMGLSMTKTSTLQAVAPGISEALVATAVGLAAAIPAAVGYNFFTSKVKDYRRDMQVFSEEFEDLAIRSLKGK